MRNFKLSALCVLASLVLFASNAFAQTATNTPAPTQSSFNFSLGSSAFGLGGSSSAQPAADVVLSLNPGLPGKLSSLSLVSDSLMDPSGDFQYYGGGVRFDLPNSAWSKTNLAPLSFYVRGTVGADRLVPPSGPSASHIAVMAGGGVEWKLSNGVQFNMVEVDWFHAPGSPWGNNAPAVSGGVSYLFGKH